MQSMDNTFTPPPMPFGLNGKYKAYVDVLLAIIARLVALVFGYKAKVRALDDELLVQKGQKKRPTFTGSNLVKKTEKAEAAAAAAARAARPPGEHVAVRRPRVALAPHTTVRLTVTQPVPPGSVRKGFEYVMTQDVELRVNNILFARERWLTPDGLSLVAEMPAAYAGGHFGPGLVAYVLGQYFDCHVSQPRLHSQLNDIGVRISHSQVDVLLNRSIEAFAAEKAKVLRTGLLHSPNITVDDSSAPHMGTTGIVTNISGSAFASFHSSQSKSRLNFLEVFHAGQARYTVNDAALRYMAEHGLSPKLVVLLRENQGKGSLESLQSLLTRLGVTGDVNRRIVTEAALWGALKGKLHPMLAVVSDGAQQFVLDGQRHGLCWVHSERLVAVLLPVNDAQRADQERVCDGIWALFRALRAYKKQPSLEQAALLDAQFDQVFQQETSFPELNAQLALLYEHKNDLLLVLRRPDVPLHTNQSETDIRDFVHKRKVSGRTRGPKGRLRRDVHMSLKQTCRKLGVSFWVYLKDRISGTNAIAPLEQLVKARIDELAAANPLVLIPHPMS